MQPEWRGHANPNWSKLQLGWDNTLPNHLLDLVDGVAVPRGLFHESGQASIYLARWKRPRQLVVIKRFHSSQEDRDDQVWPRWKSADRRYVVPLIYTDTAESNEGPIDFEVTEYQPAGSLQGWLHGLQRPAEPVEIIPFVEQITEALSHIHGLAAETGEHLVHGDVKPENLLFDGSTPSTGRLRLIDFGVSQVSTVDWQWRLEGSPLFAAPERFAGQWSPASDWWSLGMIVAQLLRGRYPFEDELNSIPRGARTGRRTDGAILLRYNQQVARFLYERLNRASLSAEVYVDVPIPPEWKALVEGLLSRDVEDRFGADDVREFLRYARRESGDYPRPRGAPRAGNAPSSVFSFAGTTVTTPPELAALMADHWAEAAQLMISQLDEVATWAYHAGGTRNVGARLRALAGRNPDSAVVLAIQILDPAAQPRFQGYFLGGRTKTGDSVRGLVDLAQTAAVLWRDGAEATAEFDPRSVVAALYESNALNDMVGSQREMQAFGQVGLTWRRLVGIATDRLARAPKAMPEVPRGQVLAHLLLAAALPAYRDDLAKMTRDPDSMWSSQVREVSWYVELAMSAWRDGRPADDASALFVLMRLTYQRMPAVLEAARQEQVEQQKKHLASGGGRPSLGGRARRGVTTMRVRRHLRRAQLAVAASRRPVIISIAGYLTLVVIAGTGVGLATTPVQGVLTAGTLLFAGAWVPATRFSRDGRLNRMMVGAWFGAMGGLLLATVAGITTSLVSGPSLAWPIFWAVWVASASAGTAWGGARS